MEMLTRITKGELMQDDSRAARLQRLVRRLVEIGGQLDDAELTAARKDGVQQRAVGCDCGRNCPLPFHQQYQPPGPDNSG